MSTDRFPFGQSDSAGGEPIIIRRLGCGRKYPSYESYRAHSCDEPESGEVYE